MRRFLVLNDETARHPFLASLPPHVRRFEAAEPAPAKTWRLPITRDDARSFLTAYCACLVAAATFIF